MVENHVAKELAFWVIGVITLLYCIAELAIALFEGSLTLLSDGFHNLSDVISLGIAFWASKAARRGKSDEMSYGWGRTEILGALTNGVFLLSLVLYTALEAIPELIEPEEEPSGWYFIGVAAAGLAVNTIGTIVFAITGQAHGHSHGGHGHSHGGHSHDSDDEEEENHGHSHGDKHGHSHGDKHGHSHGDDHGHSHGEKHGHSHGKKHGHSHSEYEGEPLLPVGEKHGHSHAHGEKKKKKKKRDMNVHAVFLHYLGDMVSSFFVLIAGFLIQFCEGEWVEYIDPVTSLLICGLILFTTLPLVKNCLSILLQSVPKHINLNHIKNSILSIDGVFGVHDFHAWQLTDGMVISSMHVVCEEGAPFNDLSQKIKRVLHKAGIHSTAIQPEYTPMRAGSGHDACAQNCVEDCKEDWCCKTPGEEKKADDPTLLNPQRSRSS